MSAWPLERTIRWGLAMATLTLLLLVGMTYFLLQETTHSALQSQAATNLPDLRRIETFLLIAMIAIIGLCVALALL